MVPLVALVVPVLDVALSSVVVSVGDNGDDGVDVPSVSFDVLVLAFVVAVAFAFASVPSRTISKW